MEIDVPQPANLTCFGVWWPFRLGKTPDGCAAHGFGDLWGCLRWRSGISPFAVNSNNGSTTEGSRRRGEGSASLGGGVTWALKTDNKSLGTPNGSREGWV